MSWELKVKTIIILSLRFRASMSIFMWYGLQMGWEMSEIVKEKFDLMEEIINWRKL